MDVTIINFLYFPPHWLLRIVFNWPNQVLAWINFFLCVKRKQLIVDSFAGNDGHSNWLTLLQFRLNQSLSKSKMVARNRISINSVVVKPLSHCMFGWIKRAVAKRKGKAIRVITSKILHAFQFFFAEFPFKGSFLLCFDRNRGTHEFVASRPMKIHDPNQRTMTHIVSMRTQT